jgi:hypothetical protein
MKKLFNDFVDFRHLTHVTKAGSESVNGFVLNLHYETMNYKAHALLKSSKKKRSDNLYYEYLVGIKFINKVNEIFPCFTETYHLFEHDSATSKKSLLDLLDYNLSVSTYSDAVKKNDCDASVIKNSLMCIDKSCQNGVNFAILVQYISNPISVGSFIKIHESDKLFEEKMLCILYQIYACLSYLKDHFTHYDLHDENVLLYELPKGKFVNIKYIDERSGHTTISLHSVSEIKKYDYPSIENGLFVPSSASYIRHNGLHILNTRYVNYTIKDERFYCHNSDGIIISKNMMSILDNNLIEILRCV